MCRVVIQQATNVTVPEWVQDRASFHRWAASDEFPDHGRIDYLAGEIWVDMSEEQVYSHNQVKTEFTRALSNLAKTTRLGRFYQDGLRVDHPEADLAAVPDGVYISSKRLQTMRVRPVEGAEGGYVRMEGAPDIVLEVISDSSVGKDTSRLRELYWSAGVQEYWLVDARREPLAFDILRHTARGYAAARKQQGWVKSGVLGKAFQLSVRPDELGHPEYTLEVR